MVFHWAKEAQKPSVHFHRCRYALENEKRLNTCINLQLTEYMIQILFFYVGMSWLFVLLLLITVKPKKYLKPFSDM